jgi:hypothetical protein
MVQHLKYCYRLICGVLTVNSETRTRERQHLMVNLLERKIRLRARQIYEQRGEGDGQALEDWIQAESEILKTSILAPLWNKRQDREASEL